MVLAPRSVRLRSPGTPPASRRPGRDGPRRRGFYPRPRTPATGCRRPPDGVGYSYDDTGKETYTQRLVYRFRMARSRQLVLDRRVLVSLAPGASRHAGARVSPTARFTSSTRRPSLKCRKASNPDMFEDGACSAPAAGHRLRVGGRARGWCAYRAVLPGRTVQYANLQLSVPVRHVRLVLEAPAGSALSPACGISPASFHNLSARGGLRRTAPPLTFEIRDLDSWEVRRSGLPPKCRAPRTWPSPPGGRGGDLSRRYSEIVDHASGSDLSAFLRSTAGGGLSGRDDRQAPLQACSEIRYTGIELGQGTLLPRPPARR